MVLLETMYKVAKGVTKCMELEKVYKLLELPTNVVEQLKLYEENRIVVLDSNIKELLMNRNTWDEGVKMLQGAIGDDPSGIIILWELLHLACESYDEYERKGIDIQIYIDTMKFCTRFVKEYYNVYGEYKFVWAWWFPRQLSLQEFRIGCLEYELIDGEEKIIAIHIPSDANLQKPSVEKSFSKFFEFRNKFFKEWLDARICCDSWLLSPSLKELLDSHSNIINFQNYFTVESTDYDSMAVLDWVFPGSKQISEQLQENTSLQRKMKRYLLEGNKIGWSKGYLKEGFRYENKTQI